MCRLPLGYQNYSLWVLVPVADLYLVCVNDGHTDLLAKNLLLSHTNQNIMLNAYQVTAHLNRGPPELECSCFVFLLKIVLMLKLNNNNFPFLFFSLKFSLMEYSPEWTIEHLLERPCDSKVPNLSIYYYCYYYYRYGIIIIVDHHHGHESSCATIVWCSCIYIPLLIYFFYRTVPNENSEGFWRWYRCDI
jgi:hypothetical protein